MTRQLSIALSIFSLLKTQSFRLQVPVSNQMSKSIRSFFTTTSLATTEIVESAKKRVKTEVTILENEKTELDTNKSGIEVLKSDIDIASANESCTDDTNFGWGPFDTLEPGWKASLAGEFKRPYFQSLLKFLSSESKSQTVFPPSNEIFAALNFCPLDQVKVQQ